MNRFPPNPLEKVVSRCLLPMRLLAMQRTTAALVLFGAMAAGAVMRPVVGADQATKTAALKSVPKLLTEEELEEGWISLFDGQTLYGWTPGSEADWHVEEGAIVVTRGKAGLLGTTTEFADYVLKAEFRSPRNTNSGIFLRTPLRPTDPAADCYELNIAPPENPFPTGSLVKRKRSKEVSPTDDWRQFEVRVEGTQVEVKLDGQPVLSYEDPSKLRRGLIGLQLNEGRAEFRRIKLKPLGLKSLFNGKDLSGWKTYPQMASKFSVTEDGELQVKGGKGQLETEQQFGDFVMQFECQTHAPNLNSGVFFRCIPGLEMMGYEAQIHHGFKNQDRTQPVDCGTGGIFRRQNARIVLGQDGEWFTMTLIAQGPHVATWVNGLQVGDWIDTRSADENPRKGLRVAPGTLMLQGHDPTTDISFRRLRAAELPR